MSQPLPPRVDPRVDPKTIPPRDAFLAAQRALEDEQIDRDLDQLRAVDARYERVLGELNSRLAVLETKQESDALRLTALASHVEDWENQKSLVLKDLVEFSRKLDTQNQMLDEQKTTLVAQNVTLGHIKQALTTRQAVVIGIGLAGTALGQLLLKVFHG